MNSLLDFIMERTKYYFREVRGFAYDEVNAVMAAGWDSLPDVEARLLRVAKVRPTADFEPLAASFKRIQNILTQAEFTPSGGLDASLVEDGAERELFAEFERASGQPLEQAIGSLRPKLDTFFDQVLVNAPDARVRANRLTLLSRILKEFSTIADFSEIVTSKES
jgi:glycyl-tRNA synthetase beta chain